MLWLRSVESAVESRNRIEFKTHYGAGGGVQRRERGRDGKEHEALSQFDV